MLSRKESGIIPFHNECWVMLVEAKETRHTGDVVTDLTESIQKQLGNQSRLENGENGRSDGEVNQSDREYLQYTEEICI